MIVHSKNAISEKGKFLKIFYVSQFLFSEKSGVRTEIGLVRAV